MMILYGKEGLRNTLLYQNHARNSNLGSNLFITYIWLVKSLILSLKITIFCTNSTLAHHFNMMLRFATKVFAKSNYHKIMGYQMRYVWTCYTDLYIYFLNQTWNIWSKNSILQGFFDFLDCQTSSNGLVMPKFEFPTKFCIYTMPPGHFNP